MTQFKSTLRIKDKTIHMAQLKTEHLSGQKVVKVYIKPNNSSNYIEYGTYNASSGKMIIQNNSKITLKPKTTYYIKLVAYTSGNNSKTTEVISSKLK